MKEATGDLWTFPADWRVITTNGFVKRNGECVMGRGCAFEAKSRFKDLPAELGLRIKMQGNHASRFGEYNLITFPVKHNWFEKADPDLIVRSARELENAMRIKDGIKGTVVMPRPGCGNGQLKWEDVKPLIEFLPDNVTVITFADKT